MTTGTVLITGSNRGLGLEFARQYAHDGWRVIACCRHPGGAAELQALGAETPALQVERLDVTQQGEVDGLADKLRDTPIDVLLSNASHLGMVQTQLFEQSDYDEFLCSYEVNALGPYRLANSFYPHVAGSGQKKMMFMGSRAGSIGSLQAPVDLFAYTSAKAALHCLVRGLHLNLAPQGLTIGLLEPGMTDTQGFMDLPEGAPAPHGLERVMELIRAGKLVMTTPEESVTQLRRAIAEMTPETGGRLVHVSGKTLPW